MPQRGASWGGHTTCVRRPAESMATHSFGRVSAPRGTLLPPEEQPAPDVVPLEAALPVLPVGWALAISTAFPTFSVLSQAFSRTAT